MTQRAAKQESSSAGGSAAEGSGRRIGAEGGWAKQMPRRHRQVSSLYSGIKTNYADSVQSGRKTK